MRTPQLVILWYATGIIAILISAAGLDTRNPLYGAVAVAFMAATLIYTLRPHPEANKKSLLFWLSLPLVVTLVGVTGY
jgi:hypothetical protein